MLSSEQKEYNRIMQQRHREREKEIEKLYQDKNITNISYSDFKQELKLNRWQKLSITLSDEELRMSRISFKLSDGNLRDMVNKKR